MMMEEELGGAAAMVLILLLISLLPKPAVHMSEQAVLPQKETERERERVEGRRGGVGNWKRALVPQGSANRATPRRCVGYPPLHSSPIWLRVLSTSRAVSPCRPRHPRAFPLGQCTPRALQSPEKGGWREGGAGGSVESDGERPL